MLRLCLTISRSLSSLPPSLSPPLSLSLSLSLSHSLSLHTLSFVALQLDNSYLVSSHHTRIISRSAISPFPRHCFKQTALYTTCVPNIIQETMPSFDVIGSLYSTVCKGRWLAACAKASSRQGANSGSCITH